MNKTIGEAVSLAEQIVDGVPQASTPDIVLCPPFTALSSVIETVSGSSIAVGAQNMHWETKGAFTGEISPEFLADMGCDWVIIGHSERRKYFAETDDIVNKKLKAALAFKLNPIVCVGETLEEREKGVTTEIVERQISGAVDGLASSDLDTLVIAYEPVWAIGTGKTASPDIANEVHTHIREVMGKLFDVSVSSATRILYGGSVTPDNTDGLIAMPDIDGALVGGASLRADYFTSIIRSASL
jgi:triosephosphate isomerase